MPPSKIGLQNQFGETSVNYVIPLAGGGVPLPAQAADTVVANLTAGAAAPTAATVLAVANRLPAKTGVTAIVAIPTPVTPITVATAGGNTYSDAAINVALAAVVADLQTQLDKVNAILAALKVVS